jgi:hypothetical protein
MIAKSTVVCVLRRDGEDYNRAESVAHLLIAQESRTHTTNHDVDGDTQRNEETSLGERRK